MIHARGLEVRYGTRTVASVPELDVGAGECVAIVGESGSGKSSTLMALLGLAEGAQVSGEVYVCGVDVLNATPRRLRELRGAKAALVMQSPQAALCPTTRLGTLMLRALRLHGIGRDESPGRWQAWPSAEQAGQRTGQRARQWAWPSAGRMRHRMAEAMRAVLLDPVLLSRYPHEVSGGQAQRFAIALAIALGAKVILADEPTSALDVTVQAEVIGVLRRLRETRGLGLLLVSHDLALVSTIADRVVVMKDGRVVDSAPFAELSHPYSRELLEAVL
ncbi:ATP-binding cassette domain-containing protein [Thermoactinospora rubra]|uniref:ATP-binding cassette domain-containing protein n=1 Tax=Thermoactinospora rubra TaxID=1088767 RepID=UPI000A0F607F|nr:ATP-binding cassette domain-containing protein [Thermoactinospora rubra]